LANGQGFTKLKPSKLTCSLTLQYMMTIVHQLYINFFAKTVLDPFYQTLSPPNIPAIQYFKQNSSLKVTLTNHVCVPTSLLLNTVSDEDTQARTDRVMLTPWVKFLWESYRNILELTKNNQTFEKLYTEVAKEGAICI